MKQITTYIVTVWLVVLGVNRPGFILLEWRKGWEYLGLRDNDITEGGECCLRPFCDACPHVSLCTGTISCDKQGSDYRFSNLPWVGLSMRIVVLWVTVRLPGFNSPYLRASLEAVCCFSGWNVFLKNGTRALVIGQMLKNFQRMCYHNNNNNNNNNNNHVFCLTTGP